MKKRHAAVLSGLSFFAIDPDSLLYLLNGLPIALHGFIPTRAMIIVSIIIYTLAIYVRIKRRKKDGNKVDT